MKSIALEPCPFCGQPLNIRHPNVNPHARCETEGCWMFERMLIVPLDATCQVEQWNRRALSTRSKETPT